MLLAGLVDDFFCGASFLSFELVDFFGKTQTCRLCRNEMLLLDTLSISLQLWSLLLQNQNMVFLIFEVFENLFTDHSFLAMLMQ